VYGCCYEPKDNLNIGSDSRQNISFRHKYMTPSKAGKADHMEIEEGDHKFGSLPENILELFLLNYLPC